MRSGRGGDNTNVNSESSIIPQKKGSQQSKIGSTNDGNMMLIPTRRPIDELRLVYKQKKRELKAARKAYRNERAKDIAYKSPNTSSEDE